MKKFIMGCPMQPEGKLNEVKYNTENTSIVYDKKTRFPIIPMLSQYTQEGETVEILFIRFEHADTARNEKLLREETERLCKEKNIDIKITAIETAYSEDVNTQIDLFGALIDKINDGDELYVCTTYGTKVTPIIEMMTLNYAYRALKDVMIRCIVYGKYDFHTGESTLFDVTSLFYMDEFVNNVAKMNVKNPKDTIKKLIDL